MIGKIGQAVGLLLMADSAFDVVFPKFDSRFFTSGPGKDWDIPIRPVMRNLGCLTPTSRRYLSVGEGIVGALLFAVASEPRGAEMARPSRGPVRVPIEHIRH